MSSRFLRTMIATIMILGLAIPAMAAPGQQKPRVGKKRTERATQPANIDTLTSISAADTISTYTKARLEQLNLPTTATLDARFSGILGIAPKIPTPEEAARMTTDSLAALFRTGRPALGIGWFQSYDAATSTVVIRMDPKLTTFPHSIQVRAKRWNIPADRLYARERSGERRFKLDMRTYIVDDSSPLKLQPGQKERLTPHIPITAFRPGDKVSVSYRIAADSKAVPKALNLSKVDPNRTFFPGDSEPMSGRPITQRNRRPTTGTAAAAAITSEALIRERMHRPRKP